eukprot:gene12536-2287_t
MLRDAQEVAGNLGARLVPREQHTVAKIFECHAAEHMYMVGRDKHAALRHELRRRRDGQRLYANPRMWRFFKGASSERAMPPLAKAILGGDPAPPAHVVDATAGLGGTALRIAHITGCHVTAVEASGPLACLLKYGMPRLAQQVNMRSGAREGWAEAAERVHTVHADAADFFESRMPALRVPCVVYLNPCMPLPKQSTEDEFLHQVACLQPISERCLRGALALARRRVVLRAPRGANLADVCHGLEPSWTQKGGQSDYLVFERQ